MVMALIGQYLTIIPIKTFLFSGELVPMTSKNQATIKIDLPLYAIDVNSKFETSPPMKNIAALTQFKKEIYEL